jgi:hypothetical protein
MLAAMSGNVCGWTEVIEGWINAYTRNGIVSVPERELRALVERLESEVNGQVQRRTA